MNRFRHPDSSRRATSRGFTILELVVVILVIAILGVLLLESFQSFQSRADRLRCTANLRSLHIALGAYTQDQNHWPQCPFQVGDDEFDGWWMKEMSPYKLGLSNWQCPTFMRQQTDGKVDKDEKKMIHYMPTPFDDGARTPYKWATQPWAVEIADFHGDGNLILFPDGSIRGFNQFSAGIP